MSKNSINNTTNGRYVLGGTTEVSLYALEWWNKTKIEPHSTDIIYYVEKQYEFKPHLLGFLFYGDSKLWWIIGMVNGIINPLEELHEKKMLRIPILERIKTTLLTPGTKSGGVPSTRIK